MERLANGSEPTSEFYLLGDFLSRTPPWSRTIVLDEKAVVNTEKTEEMT